MRVTNTVTPSVSAVVALLLLSCVSQPQAYATGFTGATVSANYDWPTLGTVLYPSGSAVVGPGVTFDNIGGFGVGNSPSVAFSDATILVTYPGGWTESGFGTYDGWVFSVLSHGPAISGVSLAGSDIPGVTASDLSFDSSDIDLNMIGLGNWGAGSYVSIDVTFANSVPDAASTAAFLGLAFTGIAALYRKFGNAKA